MAIIQRFSTIGRGGIIFTGNTAGLAPVNASGGQFAGSIAVFTSLDTGLQVAGYPAGTALSYARNGSGRRFCCLPERRSFMRSVGGFAGRR